MYTREQFDDVGGGWLALLFGGIAMLCGLLLAAVRWQDIDTTTLFWTNRDFANYWIGSRLALSGKALELFRGHEIYFAHMQAAFSADYPWHSWSYPPHYLLVILPVGLFPYLPAAIAFELTTLAFFLHAVSLAARRVSGLIVLLVIPAVACNLLTVQNGFLTSALMLYGLTLRDRRPILAGIAIGLLTVKPQLGLLLPILLLYERRWTMIFSAVATTSMLIAISTLVFGVEAWTGYISKTWPYQITVMRDFTGIFPHMMPSVFGSMRSLGFDADKANLFHLPVALMSLVTFIWSLFHLRNLTVRGFSLLFATFMISPYSFVYDLPALSVAAALTVTRGDRYASEGIDVTFLLMGLVCIMPLLGIVLSLNGLPIAPAVLALGWIAMLARQRGTAPLTPSSPPTG